MKFTLLDIVQTVLSSLDSDEVNSISDTQEAMQAAVVARTAYLNIASRSDLNETKTLFTLEPSLTGDLPTVMNRPETIQNVHWIKYNRATETDPLPLFEVIGWLCLEDFIDRMHNIDPTQPNSGSGILNVNGDAITLSWKNDVAPTYWTAYNDNIIIFDSFDSSVDSTLQKDKTLGYGEESFPFLMQDTFIPNLDEKQHQLWLNETKALAWAELKQAQHGKAEREAQKGWVNLMRTKRALPNQISELDRAPNYGRSNSGGLYRRSSNKFSNRW